MYNDHGLVGRFLAGCGGALLAVSVFLTWYSLSLLDILRAAAPAAPPEIAGALSPADGLTLIWSGWHGVPTLRFVLLGVGLAVLFGSFTVPTSSSPRRALLGLAGGLLATGLVAYRIATPPGTLDISAGLFQLQSPAGAAPALRSLLHVHAGAWVALVGGALVILGAAVSLARWRPEPAESGPYADATSGNPSGLTW